MFGSAMVGMPPQPGVWTLHFQKLMGKPGLYSLYIRDATESVYSGPHYLRFESPDYAAGFIVGWTDLDEDDDLAGQLASGQTLKTTGHSDVWLPVVYALYHSAGPVFAYNASAFWADGGHQSAQIPQDPEQEVPADCDLLLRAHEISDRGVLVSPSEDVPERVIVWSSYSWDKSISRIYHPVVEVQYEDGSKESFMLMRGPFRRKSDKAILMPAPDGEYRIEWRTPADGDDGRPRKSFLKLPQNYEELSEEERARWRSEASRMIRDSFRGKRRKENGSGGVRQEEN